MTAVVAAAVAVASPVAAAAGELTKQVGAASTLTFGGADGEDDRLNEFDEADVNGRMQAALGNNDDDVGASIRYTNRPWLDKEGKVVWGPIRIGIARVVGHQMFEMIMGAVIMFNLCLIMWETDYTAQCWPDWADAQNDCPFDPDSVGWLVTSNLILLIVYTVEACMHVFVQRGRYIYNKWNLLDILVVSTGWLSMMFAKKISVAFLRILRVLRLLRAFRITLSIRELYFLMTGLMSSIKAIVFGSIMLAMMLALWAIVVVEFVHPVTSTLDFDPYGGCSYCMVAFQSIPHAMLTLFQTVIMGDNWGALNWPVIATSPALGFILITVVVTVMLGAMNLILAVIVDSAADARERDIEERVKVKEREQKNIKSELMKLCADMDKDQSGCLTLQEMYDAWRGHNEFHRVMQMMDVSYGELASIFEIMDTDKSGTVEYKEFVDQLYALRTVDMRIMMALTRKHVVDLDHGFMRHQEDITALRTEFSEFARGHMRRLEAIDSKLDSALSQPSAPKEARDRRSTSHGATVATAIILTEAGEQLHLGGLRRYLEDLSALEDNLIRRLDDQATSLRRHAAVLTAAHRASRSTSSTDPGDELQRLAQHVQRRVARVVRELEVCVDEQTRAITGQGELVEALVRRLGLHPDVLMGLGAPAVVSHGGQPSVPEPLPASQWRSPRTLKASPKSAPSPPLPIGDKEGPSWCGKNCSIAGTPTQIYTS